MPRGRLYTPEEDAAVLRYSSTEEVNAAIAALGLPPRSDFSVKKRRSDLRKAPGSPARLGGNPSIEVVMAERAKIRRELVTLERRRATLYAALERTVAAIVADALGYNDVNQLPAELQEQVRAQVEQAANEVRAEAGEK